ASEISGIPVSRLRSAISTKELVAAGQLRGINPLVEIAVKGSGKRKVELATDALSRRGTARVSGYVTEKVKQLEQQVTVAQAQLAAVEARIEAAQRQQAEINANSTIPLTEKLLVNLNLNSVITTSDARRTALQDDLNEAQQLLNLAQNVEKSRI